MTVPEQPAAVPAPGTGLTAAGLLEHLLAVHPEAGLNALNEHAITVDLPSSVRLHGQRQHAAASGMELFTPQDWPSMIIAWEQAQSTGIGHATVHLLDDPSVEQTMYVLDVRAEHGVLIGLHHPAALADVLGDEALPPAAPLPPRFAQVRKDAAGFLTAVDRNAERMLGREAASLVGRRASELVHPDDLELGIGSWMQMLARPGLDRRLVVRHAHSDGHWLWLEVTNHNLLEDPEYGCVLADLVDLSPEMLAQEVARERQELLDRLAETVPVGLLQLDLTGRVVYANNRLHEIVGRPRADVADAQLAALVADDRDRWHGALAEVLDTGRHVDLELTFAAEEGPRVCLAALRALRDRDGLVSGAIVCLTDTTQSSRLRAELHDRATYDPLTRCLNRGPVLAHLDAVLRAEPPGPGTALAYCDVDAFKRVNDEHGHSAGDVVLQEVAARLTGFVRHGQQVGRLGGDEFLVVLPHVAGPAQARALGRRLQTALAGPVTLPGGLAVPLQVSVGTSWAHTASVKELVAEADASMYRSKRRRAAGRPGT